MADDETTPAGEPQGQELPGEPEVHEVPVPPEIAKALKAANKEAERLRLQLGSEREKLASNLQDAEVRASQAEARLLMFEVAQEKGLTAAQAKYLSGSSREELETRAEEILTDFPAQNARGFVPMFDQGARGSATTGTDMNSLIRRAAGYS